MSSLPFHRIFIFSTIILTWNRRVVHGFSLGAIGFRRSEKQSISSLAARRITLVTCSTTEETISAVKDFVRPGSSVVEIGASLKGVSSAICESLQDEGKAIMIDVPRKAPKNTSQEGRIKEMRSPGDEDEFFPEISEFREISCLEKWKKTVLGYSENFDVLVLDVNSIVGNDLEMTSLSVAIDFSEIFQCRVVVIKSAALNLWAGRLVHAQKWIDAKEKGDSSGILDFAPPHVIGTVGVEEYRKVIPSVVKEGDSILEVGCHFGTSTSILSEAVGVHGYAMGVDVGPKIIQGAKQKYPHIPFYIGDAWKVAELLRHQKAYIENRNEDTNKMTARKVGFDCIFVDVGGLSGGDGLLEAMMLVATLLNGLEPRTLVIKSQCMRRLSSRLTPYWHIRKKMR